MPEGQDVITVENKMSFLRPASGPVFSCRAQVLRAGRRLIFAEAEVTAKGAKDKVMIAKARSTLALIPLASKARTSKKISGAMIHG